MSGNGTMGSLPPDTDRGDSLIAAFAVYCSVACVVVSLRLWARHRIRFLSWDDWMMVFAWVLLLVNTILIGLIAGAGGFRHMVYLMEDPTVLTKTLEMMNVALAIAVIAMGASKISVAMLQLRLLRGASFWQPTFLRFMILLTSAYTLANVTFAFAQCNPPSKLWDLDPNASESCLPASVVADCSIFFGSLGAFTDFTLALLPTTYVWTLNQPLRTRITLVAVLGAGAFSGVCGAVKTYELGNFATADLTWNLYTAWLWAGADIFLVILCGSIPTLKPLWDMYFPSSRHRQRSSAAGVAIGASSSAGVGGRYIRSSSSGPGKSKGRGRGGGGPLFELTDMVGNRTVSVAAAGKVSAEQSSITPITTTLGAEDYADAIRVTQTVELDWDSRSKTADAV